MGEGWFAFTNDFFMTYGAELGPYGLAVAMCLACHADSEGVCWPKREVIAKETGVSDRQVRRELLKMEGMGLLSIHTHIEPGEGQKSNRYHLYFLKKWDKNRGVTQSPQDEPGCQVVQTGVSGSPDRGVTQSQPGCQGGIAIEEQDPLNKTQRTRPIEPEGEYVADNLSSKRGQVREKLPHEIAQEMARERWDQEQHADLRREEPPKPGMMGKEELSHLMPMAMACCQALGWDWKRQDDAGKRQVLELARDWLEMGDTPDTVPGFLAWFRKQHPGWGNPHPKQFRQEWPEYAKTLRGRVSAQSQADLEAKRARHSASLRERAAALGVRPPPGGT